MEDRVDKSVPGLIETHNEVLLTASCPAAGHARSGGDSQLPWLVRMVAPRSLQPAKRNARTHSKKQIRLIKESIKRHRLINPIVTDVQGNVIAGHARLQAALELELPLVPVIQVDHRKTGSWGQRLVGAGPAAVQFGPRQRRIHRAKPANCGPSGSIGEISGVEGTRGGAQRTRTACQARCCVEQVSTVGPACSGSAKDLLLTRSPS
jgi:hypothetical protein